MRCVVQLWLCSGLVDILVTVSVCISHPCTEKQLHFCWGVDMHGLPHLSSINTHLFYSMVMLQYPGPHPTQQWLENNNIMRIMCCSNNDCFKKLDYGLKIPLTAAGSRLGVAGLGFYHCGIHPVLLPDNILMQACRYSSFFSKFSLYQ